MLLGCRNPDCKNVSVEITASQQTLTCPVCKVEMNILMGCKLENMFSSKNSLIEEELAIQSTRLNWINPKDWLGPMALEYRRFKDSMCEGKVEASCWKLINLIEISVGLLFCLTIKQLDNYKNNTLGMKLNLLKTGNEEKQFKTLMEFLLSINDWRNISGIGHGTLVESKEPYVRKLVEWQPFLNTSLKEIDKKIKQNIRNAGIKNINISTLNGPDYIIKLKSLIGCGNDLNINPLIICGYGFDGPDLYIKDCYYKEEGLIGYRNFNRNRKKFIRINDREVVWTKDYEQIDLYNVGERKKWADWVSNQYANEITSFRNGVRQFLINTAEGFYMRGFNDDARWAMQVFENLGSRDDELSAHKLLIAFGIEAAENSSKEAEVLFEKYQSAIKNLPDTIQKAYIKTKAVRLYGCYLGEKQKYVEAVKKLEEALSNLNAKGMGSYYFTRKMLEVEINKYKLYYQRHLRPWPENKEYAEVIFMASQLYDSDLFNNRLVDTLGWVLNLYGEMLYQRVEDGELEKSALDKADSCFEFAQKIRILALQNEPNDIWIGRGYAWSLHVRARSLAKRGNIEKARALFKEALDIREEFKEKSYLKSYGLQKDIDKNKIDMEYYCNQK
jgi:tetratricopeptide (TPR) repeat protein